MYGHAKAVRPGFLRPGTNPLPPIPRIAASARGLSSAGTRVPDLDEHSFQFLCSAKTCTTIGDFPPNSRHTDDSWGVFWVIPLGVSSLASQHFIHVHVQYVLPSLSRPPHFLLRVCGNLPLSSSTEDLTTVFIISHRITCR